MIETYYSNILHVNWVMLLIMGGYFLIGKVPNKPVYNTYRISRKIMGITLLVFCLHFFVHWKLDIRHNAPELAVAFNLSTYTLAGILFGLSFISLLDHRHLRKKRTILCFIGWGVLSMILWCNMLFIKGAMQNIILIVAAILYLLIIGNVSKKFILIYRNAVTKMQNYYTDDTESFIHWMSKSAFFTVGMGFTGAIMAFMPAWLVTVYAAVGILMFFYIFTSFIDYIVDSDKVEIAVTTPDADNEDEDEASNQKEQNTTQEKNYAQIKSNLESWLADEGYLESGLTIESLANTLQTNRTYLSFYINNQYGCTFRKWITGLRLEVAKQRLLEEPDSTVAVIAEGVGFSSCSYFTSLFTENEKQSPAKWREANAQA